MRFSSVVLLLVVVAGFATARAGLVSWIFPNFDGDGADDGNALDGGWGGIGGDDSEEVQTSALVSGDDNIEDGDGGFGQEVMAGVEDGGAVESEMMEAKGSENAQEELVDNWQLQNVDDEQVPKEELIESEWKDQDNEENGDKWQEKWREMEDSLKVQEDVIQTEGISEDGVETKEAEKPVENTDDQEDTEGNQDVQTEVNEEEENAEQAVQETVEMSAEQVETKDEDRSEEKPLDNADEQQDTEANQDVQTEVNEEEENAEQVVQETEEIAAEQVETKEEDRSEEKPLDNVDEQQDTEANREEKTDGNEENEGDKKSQENHEKSEETREKGESEESREKDKSEEEKTEDDSQEESQERDRQKVANLRSSLRNSVLIGAPQNISASENLNDTTGAPTTVQAETDDAEGDEIAEETEDKDEEDQSKDAQDDEQEIDQEEKEQEETEEEETQSEDSDAPTAQPIDCDSENKISLVLELENNVVENGTNVPLRCKLLNADKLGSAIISWNYEKSSCKRNCTQVIDSVLFEPSAENFTVTTWLRVQLTNSGNYQCSAQWDTCEEGVVSNTVAVKVYTRPYYGVHISIIASACFLLVCLLMFLSYYSHKIQVRSKNRYYQMVASTNVQFEATKNLQLPSGNYKEMTLTRKNSFSSEDEAGSDAIP